MLEAGVVENVGNDPAERKTEPASGHGAHENITEDETTFVGADFSIFGQKVSTIPS